MGIKDAVYFLLNKKVIISSAINEINECFNLYIYSENTYKIIMLQRKSTVNSIKNAKSIQEVNNLINEFKKFINNTETLVEEENRLKKEKLEQAKLDALNQINNYPTYNNYNSDEINQLFNLRKSTGLEIKNCEDEYIIEKLVSEFKQKISEINSISIERNRKLEIEEKERMNAKKLENAKIEAINKISEYCDFSLYNNKIQETLKQQYNSTVTQIKNSKNIQEVNDNVIKFKIIIDNTETLIDEEKRLNAEKLSITKTEAIREIENYGITLEYTLDESYKLFELRAMLIVKIEISDNESKVRMIVKEYKLKVDEFNNEKINYWNNMLDEKRKNSFDLICIECNTKIKKLLEDEKRIMYRLKHDKSRDSQNYFFITNDYIHNVYDEEFKEYDKYVDYVDYDNYIENDADLYYNEDDYNEDEDDNDDKNVRLDKLSEKGFSERIKNYKIRLENIRNELLIYHKILNNSKKFFSNHYFYHIKLNKKFKIMSFNEKLVICVDSNGNQSKFSILQMLKNDVIE